MAKTEAQKLLAAIADRRRTEQRKQLDERAELAQRELRASGGRPTREN